MKRFLTFLLICILLLPQGLSFSFGESGITFYSADQVRRLGSNQYIDNTIYERDPFYLRLEFSNNTGGDIKLEGNNAIRSSDSSTFRLLNSEVPSTPVKDGERFYVWVELVYQGDSKYFEFELTYTDSEGLRTHSDSAIVYDLYSERSDKDNSGKETPSNPVPVLMFDGVTIPTVDAGKTLDLKLTLKNNSRYSARNIVVTPQFEETEGDPFVLEAANLKRTINNLSGNKSTNLNFKLKISDNAQAKTHALKFKFDFVDSNGGTHTGTETIYITVTNSKTKPKLLLSRLETTPKQIHSGEPVEVVLYMENNGNLLAKNVTLALDGLESNGFTVVNGGNSQFFKEIRGGSEVYAVFNLHASSRLTNGNHNLTLKLNYQDQAGNEYTEEQLFFLTVGDELGRGPQLEIKSIDAPNGGLGPNDSFLVSFDLTNQGETTARNVKVSVDGQEALLPKSQNIRIIPSLAAKETSNQQFYFYVSSDASKQNHPLLIKVEYDQGSEETRETIQQYVGINVDSGGGNTTPKIIIDEYSFQPQIVRAGQNFDLALSFLNTHQTKAVENVKIFLTAIENTEKNDNVFTPVNSSNTFYIDYIPPKGRVDEFLTFYAVPDAQPKTYTITANFEYEDQDGEEYKATELIGIPVVQQSRLEVSDFSLPSESFMGQPMFLFTEFYNMGKVTLSNLMVKVEGNFEVQNGSYFVGNFETGQSDYFEATIIPNMPGPLEGEVIFSYEDSAGDTVEIRKPISSNVIEMPQDEFPMDEFPPMEPEQSFFKKVLKSKIFWGIIILLALGGGGFFAWKRIKKKKGMAEDEVY